MKNKKIVIRQYVHWLLFEIIIVIGSIVIVAFELLDSWFEWGITDNTDFGPYNTIAILFFLPIAIPVIHKIIKNKGTIEITNEYAYAKYAYKLQKGFVDFQEDVYYAFFKTVEGQKYILISNEVIKIMEDPIEKGIDYTKQVPIPYIRKVRRQIPKPEWKPIIISSSKYF